LGKGVSTEGSFTITLFSQGFLSKTSQTGGINLTNIVGWLQVRQKTALIGKGKDDRVAPSSGLKIDKGRTSGWEREWRDSGNSLRENIGRKNVDGKLSKEEQRWGAMR